jgi:hypothetical protein
MIGELKRDPIFRKEMEEIRKRHRPEPKLFHPKDVLSIETWKYESGVIAGFDLLYTMLMEKYHE